MMYVWILLFTRQPRSRVDAKDRENLLSNKAAIDTEFRKFWEDMKAQID